ncbi:MAG: VTT domain-containing protein [Gemmatimonadota bacterium]
MTTLPLNDMEERADPWWRRLTRRRGTVEWDAAIRGTGLVGLLAIPLILWVPRAVDLALFVLATVWCHGPLSPFLPATFEPILILFGRLYPPALVALIGTVANVCVEYFNYHMYRGVLRLQALERLRASVEAGRLMRWFAASPFFAIWFGTVTPIPDWLGRVVAGVAEYPPGRYLLAHALGRFPRFLLFAAVGHWLAIPVDLTIAITLATIAMTVMVAVVRWRRTVRRSRMPAPASSPAL